MSLTTRLSHITILKEDNFNDWIIDVRAHLRKEKLWKYTQEIGDKKSLEWEEKAQEAADFMTPTISPAVKRKLTEAEFDNGYLMISRLTSLLQPKGDAQFMRLTREYYTLSASTFKDIPEFLTHIKVLEEQIDATNVEMTGDKRTLLCLSMALPEEYRPLVQLWSMTPDITAEKAKEMVLEEHRRTMDHEKEKDTNSTAYAGRFGKQSRPDRPEVGRCPVCQRLGHTKDTCWKEHEELMPDWFKERVARRRQNRAGLARHYDNGAF